MEPDLELTISDATHMERTNSPAPWLCFLLGAVALAGCDPARYGEDPPQIMERWALNYFGECSSWLRSHTSGKRYCASPPFRVEATIKPVGEAGPKFDETKTDQPSLMAAGEQVYGATCAVCHQADGKGKEGQFPPLAGSGEFYGDPRNHAKIAVQGLSGEIVVQGATWSGAMPPQGHLSDYELAAALTYERNAWGNNDGVVLPADVAAVR
jgi:mono/diheme cytochrome c family protein